MLKVDIVKHYKGFTLKANIEAGNETVGLLGASGSGKSMTLRCIAGLLHPDSGVIEIDGTTLFNHKKKINLDIRKRRVGLLFQHYALFPNMTVRENILAGLSNEKNGTIREEKLKNLIKRFHLTGLEGSFPNQLSGGESQRVALARIIGNEPKTLLLDEPFSALDSYTKWKLEIELSDILSEFSGTVLYVSHDRDEVFRLCESVVTVTSGNTERKKDICEFFKNPDTYASALLSGCKNFSRIKKIDLHSVFAYDWNTVLSVDSEVIDGVEYVGARAHYLKIAEEDGENTVKATVVRITDNLFSRVIMCEADGETDERFLRVETALSEKTPELNSFVNIKIEKAVIMLLEGK
ncbi:MAG: ATP-binding cassette domain-containing protein [Clostridia bacterium]